MRKALFLLLTLLLLAALTLPLAAQTDPAGSYGIRLLDRADLFTPENEATIAAKQGGNTYGTSFYLVTSGSRLYGDYAADLCGVGAQESAVILVIFIESGEYFYEMFTYGGADKIFSDSDVDRILDATDVKSIKRGALLSGTLAFFDRCQAVLEQDALDAQAWEDNRIPRSILIGAVAGLLIGGGSVLGVFLYYRRKRHGESYPLDRYAKLNLIESQDRFVGSYVTRVRVQSGSSGGRGGGRIGGSRGMR